MAWVYLVIAGLFEVVWVIGLRAADGFTKPVPTLLTFVAMAASLGALGLAMRSLPLGLSYAVWTGIGTIGAMLFGILALGEAVTLPRVVAILLILSGIAMLKLAAH